MRTMSRKQSVTGRIRCTRVQDIHADRTARRHYATRIRSCALAAPLDKRAMLRAREVHTKSCRCYCEERMGLLAATYILYGYFALVADWIFCLFK